MAVTANTILTTLQDKNHVCERHLPLWAAEVFLMDSRAVDLTPTTVVSGTVGVVEVPMFLCWSGKREQPKEFHLVDGTFNVHDVCPGWIAL